LDALLESLTQPLNPAELAGAHFGAPLALKIFHEAHAICVAPFAAASIKPVSKQAFLRASIKIKNR
jgi:hypothetical protein